MTTEIALEFNEVLSVLKDTSNIILTRFSGGKFKSDNKPSLHFIGMLEDNYGADKEDITDGLFSTLSFFKWNTTTLAWELKENYITLLDYLFRQYGNSYCVNSPSLEDEEIKKFCVLFLDSLLDMSIQNYDKFNTIIEGYKANENKLLDPVKNETTYKNFNKYKETPQGAVSIEDLGDDYNTNVSVGENQGETLDQRGTPLERLLELDTYKKIFEEWAKEFQPLFWEV